MLISNKASRLLTQITKINYLQYLCTNVTCRDIISDKEYWCRWHPKRDDHNVNLILKQQFKDWCETEINIEGSSSSVFYLVTDNGPPQCD